MITVATKLDVPIKLVFEGPTRASMLGLGDIVLPGIFVALCLRFDHYMYYHRQRKLVPVELKTETRSPAAGAAAAAAAAAAAEAHSLVATTRETRRMVVKPEYVNPQGQWGDWFWGTRILSSSPPSSSSSPGAGAGAATPALRASAFPKTYFHAAMAGYLVAMLVTLAMLLAFNHAQPALLYLVPGVVAAAWLTGAARRELGHMWAYTEDGSLDKEDVVVEVDENGDVIRQVGSGGDGDGDGERKKKNGGEEGKTDKPEEKEKEENDPRDATNKSKSSRAVVHFSIYPPSPSPSD